MIRQLLISAGLLTAFAACSAGSDADSSRVPAVVATGEHGIAVAQLNLDEMTRAARSIYRGVVLEARPGSVRGGGGDIPTVTYRISVIETHKGAGDTVAEMTMMRSPINAAGRPVIEGIPELRVGDEYLLFTGSPSAIGLSAPVGLGQGAFRVQRGPGGIKVKNELDNRYLFRGMTETAPARGPVPYAQVTRAVRATLAQ